MDLPVRPPLAPMLARLARELPAGDVLFEPKWDGFRCLVFRDGHEVDLRSRHDRPLARYFPEVVEAIRGVARERFVLDGELVVVAGGRSDFTALLSRLHPAASRATRLSVETPATFVAFDLLALDDAAWLERPFAERRRALEGIARPARSVEEVLRGGGGRVVTTPISRDPADARRWLDGAPGGGVDGVVAKPPDLTYRPGERALAKVKRERTADCVVAGFRWLVDRPLPSSLLLGLYDDVGELRHVGLASGFSEARRRALLATLEPLVVAIEGHPWERGFLLGGSPMGRLKGAAGRWSPEMGQDWVPVRPQLVCEVAYDHVDVDRFRHPARFRRWRPDRDPRSCTFEQLEPSGQARAS